MRGLLAAAGAFVLCGCETFGETYSLQREVLIEDERVLVYEEIQEDFWGSRWYQYTAINKSGQHGVCVQVRLDPGAQTSGHAMGGVKYLPPGQSLDIGYVHLPASFSYDAQAWAPSAGGACGSPPR